MLGSLLVVVMAVALIACGPIAPAAPDENAAAPAPVPLVLADDPTPTPEPAPEAEPEPTSEPTAEPVDPTKPPFTPKTPRPRKHRLPSDSPPRTPDPEHPDGLDGCKSVVLFRDDAAVAYQGWCTEALAIHVAETCRPMPLDEQRQCGEDIVAEYDSFFFRHGPAKCAAIFPGARGQRGCSLQSSEDFGKAMTNLWEAGDKVRVGGDRDPEVVKAWEATVSCLEVKGFKNASRDVLFEWQRFDLPPDKRELDGRLSAQDKDLREQLIQPSRDCAKQEGLFEAQDAAWAAELRRLNKAEPALVADLIREGFLEALEKPGVTTFLSGDLPPYLTDDAS